MSVCERHKRCLSLIIDEDPVFLCNCANTPPLMSFFFVYFQLRVYLNGISESFIFHKSSIFERTLNLLSVHLKTDIMGNSFQLTLIIQ